MVCLALLVCHVRSLRPWLQRQRRQHSIMSVGVGLDSSVECDNAGTIVLTTVLLFGVVLQRGSTLVADGGPVRLVPASSQQGTSGLGCGVKLQQGRS